MTLFDFWQCVKRYFYIAIGLPILFAMITALVVSDSESSDAGAYTATVRVYSNTGSSLLAGLVEGEASNVMRYDPDVIAKVEYDSLISQVTLHVSSNQGGKSAEVAAKIASLAIDKAESLFSEDDETSYKNYTGLPFEATVLDNSVSADVSSLGRKWALSIVVGFCGGLVLAICIIVLIYAIRRPVISKNEIEECFQLPVLAVLGKRDCAERLLANIRFAVKDDGIDSVCLVPVSVKSDCQKAVSSLEQATVMESASSRVVKPSNDNAFCAEDDDARNLLVIYKGDPLTDSIKAAYASRDMDVTLIVAKKWNDSMKMLKNVTEELLLADANLAGYVLIEK